ncbi:protein MpABCG7 [Marchantia polymorpha subsp. ruderalis]|uniref:ABC transporter domain-containing protein n=2 Tax=Marchantia polymorpha TaxID=3197 RepID=A0A176VZB6_MARPO|nr:hypothetical protein AXG93_4022s1190 [Marchantia polymorpha subsp. ruderalis]PTQ31580.1 hypothetical protein MARPO_0109s0013 [Marchantia polymorpha]BBN02622.1 hypothetical protein Mp_2g16720 [Marchantia polymorpha subsp. ruderalis]|eukprot:PTQ31580.1 hypothetical protein MARPO_0109s0013 [Marchantia polymorpha]
MGDQSGHASSPGEMRPLRDFQYQMSPSPLSSPVTDQTPKDLRRSASTGLSGLSITSTSLSSPLDGSRSSTSGPRTATLTFKDLKVTVQVRGAPRVVIDSVSGYAEPTKILGIMGPRESGKTSLLDTLAGRLTKNAVYEGEILLNGRRQQLTYGTAAYVSNDDVLVGTLTVRETVYLSALLRLPEGITHQEKMAFAECTIEEMGLRECAAVRVGSTFHRSGLNDGEKRRLSIALELLMRPHLVYLDDPISGLDSASALCLMARLKCLAKDGRTIIATFRQPSTDSFELIDDLILLGKGRMVYFGEASSAKEQFARSGYPCPQGYSAPEHFQRTLDPAYDEVKASLSSVQDPEKKELLFREETSQVVRALASFYANSPISTRASLRRCELAKKKGAVLVSNGRSANFWHQLLILSYRSLLNCTRDLCYYWSRLGVSILLMILIGTIFSGLGDSNSNIRARVSCLFVVLESLMLVAVLGGSPFFYQDVKLLLRERLNPHYGAATFVVGSTLASLPFLLVMSTVSGCVVYFMPGLKTAFEPFIYFVLCIFATLLSVEGVMMIVSVLASSGYMVLTLGLCVQGVNILVAGFFMLLDDLPKTLWRYPLSFLSFHTYALRGLVVNEFQHSTFSNTETSNGEALISRVYGTKDPSKWTDFAVVMCLAIVYRFVLYCLILLYERLEPLIVAVKSQHQQKKASSRNLLEQNRRPGDSFIPQARSVNGHGIDSSEQRFVETSKDDTV